MQQSVIATIQPWLKEYDSNSVHLRYKSSLARCHPLFEYSANMHITKYPALAGSTIICVVPGTASSPQGAGGSADDQGERGIAIAPEKPKLAKPPLYKVLLFNDDYTPMEFVVDVLTQFFRLPVEKATQIMLKVHTEGSAVCGVYSRDVAETKAQQVNQYAREHQQPLLCGVEVDQ